MLNSVQTEQTQNKFLIVFYLYYLP